MANNEDTTEMLRNELRAGFSELNGNIEQTNKRLDNLTAEVRSTAGLTNQILGLTNQRLESFQQETTTRLDGIGVYLKSINGGVANNSERIFNLEQRVNKLEQGLGS